MAVKRTGVRIAVGALVVAVSSSPALRKWTKVAATTNLKLE